MGLDEARVLKNKTRRLGTHMYRCLTHSPRIIVSLTSYPPRISTVWQTIRSLLAQKTLPDKIIIWLCKTEFPRGERDLPDSLKKVLWHDVEIRWVDDNLGPHKKYFWALQEFADDIVITADDDLIYRNTMISDLMSMHQKFPHAVIASRTHLMMFQDNGELKPYKHWIFEAPHYYPRLVGIASPRLFATNGAGTLYPPHSMPAETFNKPAIMGLCPNADDLWLKVMQIKAGIPVVASTDDQLLNYVPGTQGQAALTHENIDRGGNDVVLPRIVSFVQARRWLESSFPSLVQDPSLDKFITNGRPGA